MTRRKVTTCDFCGREIKTVRYARRLSIRLKRHFYGLKFDSCGFPFFKWSSTRLDACESCLDEITALCREKARREGK